MTKYILKTKWTKQPHFPACKLDNDPNHWSVKIHGPVQSIYQDGIYTVNIKFPEVYPFVPPELIFTTKIWHPNICPLTGKIDFYVLFNHWLVSISIEDILNAIEQLLIVPRFRNTFSEILFTQYHSREFVNFQFCKNPKKFKRTAVHWTRKYANSMCFRGGSTFNCFRDSLFQIDNQRALVNHSLKVSGL